MSGSYKKGFNAEQFNRVNLTNKLGFVGETRIRNLALSEFGSNKR